MKWRRRRLAAVARDEREAQRDVHAEGQRISGCTGVLMAKHVEQPLDRADGGTDHESDRGYEHDAVAGDELRTE